MISRVRSWPRPCRLLLGLILGSLPLSCGQAILSAPVGSTLAIFVNPPFIAAQGDTAAVSVFVLEPAGTPVPDGTVVQFFSTLGTIQKQGKTNDGVARVNLVSDTRSGTAKVTAFSGPSTASVDVIVGATRPARVLAGALDRISLSLGQTIANFRVTVLDANGNFVVGVPVRFTVLDNPVLDTILETADPLTNNNGEAAGRVQTKRKVTGTIRIRADVIAATALSVEFVIQVIE